MEETKTLEQAKAEVFTAYADIGKKTPQETMQIFDEEHAKVKARGVIDEEQAQRRTLRVMANRLKKRLSRAANKKEYSFVVLGKNLTDFQLSYNYEKTMKKWGEGNDAVRAEMVASGEVNPEGQALYQKSFRKGQVITDPYGNFVEMMHFYGKRKDEEAAHWGIIRNQNFKQHSLPLYRKLTMLLVPAKKDEANFHSLIMDSPEDIISTAQEEVNLPEFAGKYFGDKVKTIAELEDYHATVEQDRNRIVFLKCDVISLYEGSPQASSHTLNVSDDTIPIASKELALTTWLPKTLQLNFSEEATDIMVMGRTDIGKRDGKIQLNIYGVWVPEDQKVKEKPQSIATPTRENIRVGYPELKQPLPSAAATAESPF